MVVRNGYLDISDLSNIKRYSSTPELFSPSLINIEIDPKNPPPYPDLWFKWVKDWLVDDDAIHESQKWSGYSLISNFLYKAMLCCLGHGDSGKTTWLYHFPSVLGGSMLFLDVERLGSPYGLARAPGKLLVVVDDATWTISRQNFGLFKTVIKNISGGTPVAIRQMRNAQFDMLLFAKLIFATDDPPRFSDPGGQFATRWKYLQFQFDFERYKKKKSNKIYSPEEIRKLIREMKAGIFWHYSLPGLKMLENDKGFVHPKNTMDIIAEVEFASRPYLTFFRLCCEYDENKIGWFVETGKVYLKWREFCEANDFIELSSYNDHKTFTREFKRYIKGITAKEHIFYGFKLNPNEFCKNEVKF